MQPKPSFLHAHFVLLFLLLVAGCSSQAQAAPQITFVPTETAIALQTPTTAPTPVEAAANPLLSQPINWDDVTPHKQAMKAGYENDVLAFANRNRYIIHANLRFETDAVINGVMRTRYTNNSSDTLNLIVFRLYPNTPALGGRLNVYLAQVDGQPVTPSFTELRSVMGIPLATPLLPGDSVDIGLGFTLVMTKNLDTSYGRFGYVSGVVSATAWYPTLSVYSPSEGWWQETPSPSGDPGYSESGLYKVCLNTPADQVVAASGTIVSTNTEADGTVTHCDITGPMRDHAFQASSRYTIATETVEGTRVNIVYYNDMTKLEMAGTENAKKYAADSVRAFNQTFGHYPYAEMDIVQNPTPSGVEFPGLVQISQSAWRNDTDYLEIVIAHEIGHQWFYALIGNNQVRHPWLDESLTSYTEFVYMRYVYPESESERAKDYVDDAQQNYSAYTALGQPSLPLDLPVRRFAGIAYGAIVYTKGPLFYVELERQLGREVVYKALAAYFQQYKYEIVTSPDVENALEKATGSDLTALFDEWVYGKQ
jgi:Peptidase family M1 domain